MALRLLSLARQHHILIWLCAVIAVNQLGFGIIVPVVPLFAEAFGVPTALIGMAVAVYGLGRLLFNLPMGQLTERFGRRQVILWGEVITAVGSLLCGLAPSFEWLFLFRFVSGIGAATVLTGAQVMLTDISTPENRGRMMSFYMGWFLFAVGLGPTPGGLIARWFGLQAPFFAFAALGVAAAVICWLRLPETRDIAHRTTSATAGAPPGASPRPPILAVARQLLTSPGFALVSLVTFAQFLARTGAIFTVVPVMAQSRLGLDAFQIGTALTLGNMINLSFTPVAGILVDRFGRRTVIVPSTLLSGITFLVFSLVDSYPLFLASCLLWGLSGGIGGSAPGAYAADLAPRGAAGATMGIYRTLADAGYVVGPALLGLVADLHGASTSLLVTASLFLVAGTLFGMLAPETHPSARLKAQPAAMSGERGSDRTGRV